MSTTNRWWLIAVLVVGALSWGQTATAQLGLGNQMQIYDYYNSGTAARSVAGHLLYDAARQNNQARHAAMTAPFSVGTSTVSKPFSSHRATPTVSPWLNMFRDDLTGEGDLNYQTLVRPQLQQQQFNNQLERQNLELGRRVQAVSAQSAYQPQGSQQMYPTGHPTAFMNYMHYYPALRGGR